MTHVKRSLLIGAFLSSLLAIHCPAFADGVDRLLTVRDHEPLWTHCVSEWSAEAWGDTWCAWALVNGYPRSAPAGERSCAKAIDLGIDYFPLLQVPRKSAGLYCAMAVEGGPAVLQGW